MLIVFCRALILYAVVFVVIRLMGKKELSKVQPFELAIIILISDLASAPMSSRNVSIFDGIVPIITLLVAYIIFTLLVHSSNKVEDIMCGKIVPIIRDGKIIEENFDKNKYIIEDIMTQLREHDVFKIQDDVNISKKDKNNTNTPNFLLTLFNIFYLIFCLKIYF